MFPILLNFMHTLKQMKLAFTFFCLLMAGGLQAQNIGIGTNTPHPSAQLDISSARRGFLPPRMTLSQIEAIASPAAGLVGWCIDCGANGQLLVYDGTGWSAAVFSPVSRPLPPGTHSCGRTDIHNTGLAYGLMTDQDGNRYKTIQIGTQEWMAENLKVRRYRNGDSITVVGSDGAWTGMSTGATCWYNNDSVAYDCPYGKLYNGYAVADARNLCPVGWHVPTDGEWNTLIGYLDPAYYPGVSGTQSTTAGRKMKSAGTQYWSSVNMADNSSGFSALPAGFRYGNASFSLAGTYAGWWSATSSGTFFGWFRYQYGGDANILRGSNSKAYGYSVRCVRD
jgi:uncharacterized protein (TIGR02145 family)